MSKKRSSESHIEEIQKKIQRYQALVDEELQKLDEVSSDSEGKSSRKGDDTSSVSEGENEHEAQDGGDGIVSQPTEGKVDEDKENTSNQLSAETHQCMGMDPKKKAHCFEIHSELAACWTEFINNEIPKEEKTSLLKQYPLKGNCPVKAPILNPEILSLLQKSVKSRDKYLAANQDLVGHSLVPLGQALNMVFNEERDGIDKNEPLQLLADSSKAPWIFTKILKPVTAFLRAQKYSSVIYLDDWLCLAESKEECEKNVRETAYLLESLGFIINREKRKFLPSKKCQFLGFILNPESMSIDLPQEEQHELLQLVQEIKTLDHCSIRRFAQFVGCISSACTTVAYGRGHSKSFERARFLALATSGGYYDAKMRISSQLIPALNWWEEHLASASNPIRKMSFNKVIYSDASNSGWGACFDGQVIFDSWNHMETSLHINQLELIAALNGLRAFASESCNQEILLRVDNTTAISYINRMDGIKFPHLNRVAREIWEFCEERRLWVYASYIPSRENVEADQASRLENADTKWILADWAFNSIVEGFGEPEVDLFASRDNNKCENHCSWHRDSKALSIDAFTIDWNSYFYAFPPFAMILKVLRKVVNDQACGIMVVPDWKSQPWYPLWLSLLEGEPLVFEPQTNLLLSSSRNEQHPLASKLRLMAGRVSGKLFQEKS